MEMLEYTYWDSLLFHSLTFSKLQSFFFSLPHLNIDKTVKLVMRVG